MQYLCAFACLLVGILAQEYEYLQPQAEIESYPEWYSGMEHLQRHRRQLSIDHKTGDVSLRHNTSPNGQVFGTLGSRGESLFGKAGYKQNVFDDHRGKLDATAYGTRVLSPYGNSNHLGGRVDWQNQHAGASLDVSKQMRGPTAIEAAAGGRWPVGKNGEFSVDGTYNRYGKIHDYGARAGYKYRF